MGAGCLAWASAAGAEENGPNIEARCRALRAEARSTASVLQFPTLSVQGVRFPQFGDVVAGEALTPGQGFQARLGVSLSAIDILRGYRVLSTADAECDQWIAREDLEVVLQQGATYGHIDALREQIAKLEESVPKVRHLVEEARRRLERELITVMEVEDLELRGLYFEARLIDLRHELSLLKAQTPSIPLKPLAESLQRYERATMAIAGEHSQLRQLTAWKVDFQAGAIPYPQRDWFGLVTVGYNLGGIRQRSAEAEARQAREEDMKLGPGDLRARVKRFGIAMRESASRLQDELQLIDQRLGIYRHRLASGHADSEKLRHLLATLEIEQLELQARRMFVEKLFKTRSNVGKELP